MSHRLIQKVIEAGIVPEQSIKLLKMWRLVDPALPDHAVLEEKTQQQLLEFVEQIASILSGETELPELKETMPDVSEMFREHGTPCKVVREIDGVVDTLRDVVAVEDLGGCLHVRVMNIGWEEVFMKPGSQIHFMGKVLEVVEVTPCYNGDHISHHRCQVQEIPEHAEMRRLREVSVS